MPAKKIPEHRGPYSTSPEGGADAATDAADAATDAADLAADAADSASVSADAADAADAVADASDSDASDSAWVGGAEAAAAAGSADRAPGGEMRLGVERSTRPLSRFAQICLARHVPFAGAEGKAYRLMKAEQPEGFGLQSCNAVLQFAPNPAVCALSSDVLCLDALAAAIAEDEKSIWELVREFEQSLTRHISPEAIA